MADFPEVPKWSESQQKLHDEISKAADSNMPSHEMTPVFDWWAKWSRYASGESNKQL